MKRLPSLSPREVIKALSRIGYEIDHQKGSHVILRNIEPPHRRLTISNRPEIARGTLRAIIRQAGLSLEEFLKLLKR